MATSERLLQVSNLEIGVGAEGNFLPIVRNLSLSIDVGEVVALVGESGSGKSMTARALMRLLPNGIAITRGSIDLRGKDLLALNEREMCSVRGNDIAMIYQQPQSMLDPTSRIGIQVAESLRIHRGVGRAEGQSRVVDLFKEVGIPEPELRSRAFAYQFSGGMAQRAMIAAALSADPALLIADEPTTALDVTVQAQILALLHRERQRRRLAILLITHDLGIVSALADRVAVIYKGSIVEEGQTDSVLNSPRHPYTQGLIQSSRLEANESGALFSIPPAPNDVRSGRGCAFYPRCETSHTLGIAPLCSESEPSLVENPDGSTTRCWAAHPPPTSRLSHEVVSDV
ncbi:ABC transporter ATP-binding protein [Devosia sp.]|uniref:ABC transporter ATP-binding protein n=1 Tax=Devosia sp. TaxID=1871048 RepID=UPI00292D5DFB|nr:ABC transporter ATP-binding protein [Devosia sp.]